MKIRIGTRGSELARKQTELVIDAISKAYPDCVCETVILRTEGDRILDKPLMEFGGKGVFVTEFEEALQEGKIDLAVHSAKDMPMELAKGLTICGVLPREDVRDVLVTRKGHPLQMEHFLQKRKQEEDRNIRMEMKKRYKIRNLQRSAQRLRIDRAHPSHITLERVPYAGNVRSNSYIRMYDVYRSGEMFRHVCVSCGTENMMEWCLRLPGCGA